MKELKITPQKWYVFHGEEVPTGLDTAINSENGRCIGWVYGDSEQGKANAQLIAEAGTVANQCGLTPKELLEQRNELLEACKQMMKDHPYAKGMDKIALLVNKCEQ